VKSERTVTTTVVRRIILLCVALFSVLAHSSLFTLDASLLHAQYNTDRLLAIGRSALYYEDYVLSMQYFNQIISAKPYLYEPWFFRAIAKYNLDDFAGAEADCTEAIQRNPFVENIYELRGLSRIQQKKFADAIADYNTALRYDPENRGLWHNRVLCHMRNGQLDVAMQQLDSMLVRWSRYSQGYAMQADIYMQRADTTAAIASLEKSLEIDPYDGHTWAARSIISLSREQWKEAEEQLDKSIHLLPKLSGNYINRALARFNQNNLRGAMADYDTALDLDPNSFLGHYNRGLLRSEVGDDNRAITDFDFVLRLEPNNLMALFNRAVLLDKTGDLRGAIRDYSKVIEQYPNFWTGLQFRASCYRRLGMTRQAEQDEFTVYKAQLDKRLYGKQPRLNARQMRKRSDDDPDKYNQLVVEDEQEVQHEYQSDYRGHVQHHKVDVEFQPMFALSFEQPADAVRLSNAAFDRLVEEMNEQLHARTLYIYNKHQSLTPEQSALYFQYIDSLSLSASRTTDHRQVLSLLFLRSVGQSMVQNYEGAIDDLNTILQSDSTHVLALWQRAVCQSRYNQFLAADQSRVASFDAMPTSEAGLKHARVLRDLDQALQLSPNSAYLLYNRGCHHAQQQDYEQAIADFTRALSIEPRLAEAYFNRGLCAIYAKQSDAGLQDLSKAGELGLYTAYGIIKKYSKQER